jgi:AcrR family transcriptional regulator
MTKKEPKEIRINQILEAAVIEFVEKGYENASMESIALRTGITKGGIYYHFSSKDELLLKVNDKFMEPIIQFISEAINNPDPAEGLSFYIRNYMSFWVNHRSEMIVIFLSLAKTFSNQALSRTYADYARQTVSFFESLYSKGIEKGIFKKFSPRSAAYPLLAALDGIIGYLAIEGGLDLEETVEAFTETFITRYRKSSHEK